MLLAHPEEAILQVKSLILYIYIYTVYDSYVTCVSFFLTSISNRK